MTDDDTSPVIADVLRHGFPCPDGLVACDEDGVDWVVVFYLFGRLTDGRYDPSPIGYQLTDEDPSKNCDACSEDRCVRRMWWVIDAGIVYCEHCDVRELN